MGVTTTLAATGEPTWGPWLASGDWLEREILASGETPLPAGNRVNDADSMHARFYNPQLGRFLSVDPARDSARPRAPQTWNRYAYVVNNPLKYIDPDGKRFVIAQKTRALRRGLVQALRRPTFRERFMPVAMSRDFTVTLRDAPIEKNPSVAEVRLNKARGIDTDVTFGRIMHAHKGVSVTVDMTMVAHAPHPDSSGVVTLSHELAGHAADRFGGMSWEDMGSRAAHKVVEDLGYAIKAEKPDLTPRQAQELLEQILRFAAENPPPI